jgi:hypothetical protein
VHSASWGNCAKTAVNTPNAPPEFSRAKKSLAFDGPGSASLCASPRQPALSEAAATTGIAMANVSAAMTSPTVTTNSMRLMVSATSSFSACGNPRGGLLRLYKENYGAPFGLPHCQNYLICAVGGT